MIFSILTCNYLWMLFDLPDDSIRETTFKCKVEAPGLDPRISRTAPLGAKHLPNPKSGYAKSSDAGGIRASSHKQFEI
jgi:hypothetical protein